MAKHITRLLTKYAIGMIYLGTWAPRGWQITDFTAIIPLANQIGCHALLPVSLPLPLIVIVILHSSLLMIRQFALGLV
jgi:hypothetical protein